MLVEPWTAIPPLKYFGRITSSAIDAAMAALHAVGLSENLGTPASELSYGEQRRLELAMDALRCPPGDTPVAILSGGERRRLARPDPHDDGTLTESEMFRRADPAR